MRIRQATKQDLRACMDLDPSYVTTRVWQIIEQSDEDHQTTLTFRTSTLPRPLRVQYPRSLTSLNQDLSRQECLLVLEQEEGELRGFVDLIIEPDQVGRLLHLVVEEDYRRRGLGTHLLQTAITWCEYRRLRLILAECQTKNYPAIALYQKCGLKFCGYNDLIYANRDIALHFARILTP